MRNGRAYLQVEITLARPKETVRVSCNVCGYESNLINISAAKILNMDENHRPRCNPGYAISENVPAAEVSKRFEPYPKAVVVLAGGRDNYQLPLALHEGEMLDTLVTDLDWSDKKWFSALSGSLMPGRILSARYCPKLDGSRVFLSKKALVASTLSHIAPRLNLNRYKDRAVSKKGGRIAVRNDAALFCCNYYASEAFKHKDALKYRFLFQLQTDFLTLRRILLEELERTPIAAASLSAEYELSLTDRELEELCNEPCLANGWVATSSFAARTLAERGLPAEKIQVVPYGVESDIFVKRAQPPDMREPFK